MGAIYAVCVWRVNTFLVHAIENELFGSWTFGWGREKEGALMSHATHTRTYTAAHTHTHTVTNNIPDIPSIQLESVCMSIYIEHTHTHT